MRSRLVRLSLSLLVAGVFGAAGVAAAFGLTGTPGDSPKPPTASPDSPCPPSNKNCNVTSTPTPEPQPATSGTTSSETKPTTSTSPSLQPVTTSDTSTTKTTETKPAATTTATTESGPTPPSPPPGKVDVVPTGTVLIKPPGASEAVPLSDAARIPDGTEVDVTNGQISLRTSDGSQGSFFGGRFVVARATDRTLAGLGAASKVTELRLSGGNFASACGKAFRRSAAAGKPKKPVRKLWGKAKGRFRTKGRFASATVRGTHWLTEDRCDGTLVSVKQGTVEVLDSRLKKKVLVKAGRSYLASAP